MKQHSELEQELRAKYGDGVEVRTIEVRAKDDMTIEGYASIFEDEYDLGYFSERVARGAFDGRTSDDVRLLINHAGMPLARTTNGTLELTIDERGLHYRAQLAYTQEGRDLYTLIERGDISQSSFAFTIDEDEWSGDRRVRTIKRVGQLYDVSPVTYPASPTTTVQAREMSIVPAPVEELAPAPIEQVEERQTKSDPDPIFTPNKNQFATMNLNDLKALRAAKIDQLGAINEGAKLQARGFTEAEETTIDQLNADIAELDAKVERAQKVEDQIARAAYGAAPSKSEVVEQAKVQERYSLSKLVRESMTGRLTGLEAEMSQQAAKELKDSGVGVRGLAQIPGFLMRATSTIGGTNVPGQSNLNLLEGLVAAPILEQAGANVLRGLTGNINLPSLGSDYTDIVNETAAHTSGAAIAARQLSPQRVASRIDVTNELLAAMNQSVDATIQRQFAKATASQVDEMFLTKVIAAAASTYVKRFETPAATVAGLTAAVAAKLIGSLGDANGLGNNVAFITSHGLLATARYTPTVSGGAIPIMQDDEVFGYMAYGTSIASTGLITDASYDIYSEVYANSAATTAISNEADLVPIVIANMENCFIAYWGNGAADLIIDPYTNADAGTTRLILNTYADADFAHVGDVRFSVGA